MKKTLFTTMAVLAVLIGLYPIIYLVLEPSLTFLSNKTLEVLSSLVWNIAFYTHIFTGGIALLTGWVQFVGPIRKNRSLLHRNLGKLYISTVLLSSATGIFIGFFAFGGVVAAMGFISLGMLWFYTTLAGFVAIKNQNITKHKQYMTYSYAACFAAVTLRLWLLLITLLTKDYITAYIICAWLCWIPNIVVAYFINKRR